MYEHDALPISVLIHARGGVGGFGASPVFTFRHDNFYNTAIFYASMRNTHNRICCGETKIVWGANIREGEYLTHELRPKDFRLLGNIIGVMLQVCDTILDQ